MTVEYTTANNGVEILTLENQFNIRNALSESFLFSSAFTLHTERDSDGVITSIELAGAGWGHGVGMCQIGALGMSLKGHDYKEILKQYFREAALVKSY